MKIPNDWKYSQEYKDASPAEKKMLNALVDIIFEAQYAKMGYKTGARRDASLSILKSIKTAYQLHKGYINA